MDIPGGQTQVHDRRVSRDRSRTTAGRGGTGTGLGGISSCQIPDRTETGAKAGTFNQLYGLKFNRLRKERKIHLREQ